MSPASSTSRSCAGCWPTSGPRPRAGSGTAGDRSARRPAPRGPHRPGAPDAGLDPGAGGPAGPLRGGPGGPARRRRLRLAAHRHAHRRLRAHGGPLRAVPRGAAGLGARGACTAPRCYLEFPSVGATENVLLAGAMAPGPHRHRQRGARAGDRGPGRVPGQDGGPGDAGPGPRPSRSRGCPACRRPSTGPCPTAWRPAPTWWPGPSPAGEVTVRGLRARSTCAWNCASSEEAGCEVEIGEERVTLRVPSACGRWISPPCPIPASTPTCTRRWWRRSPWPPGPR